MDQQIGTAQKSLMHMLEAREARWKARMAFARRCRALVSMTLCIPIPYRCIEQWKAFLRTRADAVCKHLAANGIMVAESEELDGADGLAIFLLFSDDARQIKMHCVRLEQDMPLGRLLDIDVTDENGTPIGRAELGLPPRKCFLCEKNAAECVASGRHSPKEVATWVEGQAIS